MILKCTVVPSWEHFFLENSLTFKDFDTVVEKKFGLKDNNPYSGQQKWLLVSLLFSFYSLFSACIQKALSLAIREVCGISNLTHRS